MFFFTHYSPWCYCAVFYDNTQLLTVVNAIISLSGEVPGKVKPAILRATNKLSQYLCCTEAWLRVLKFPDLCIYVGVLDACDLCGSQHGAIVDSLEYCNPISLTVVSSYSILIVFSWGCRMKCAMNWTWNLFGYFGYCTPRFRAKYPKFGYPKYLKYPKWVFSHFYGMICVMILSCNNPDTCSIKSQR